MAAADNTYSPVTLKLRKDRVLPHPHGGWLVQIDFLHQNESELRLISPRLVYDGGIRKRNQTYSLTGRIQNCSQQMGFMNLLKSIEQQVSLGFFQNLLCVEGEFFSSKTNCWHLMKSASRATSFNLTPLFNLLSMKTGENCDLCSSKVVFPHVSESSSMNFVIVRDEVRNMFWTPCKIEPTKYISYRPLDSNGNRIVPSMVSLMYMMPVPSCGAVSLKISGLRFYRGSFVLFAELEQVEVIEFAPNVLLFAVDFFFSAYGFIFFLPGDAF